MGEGAWQAGDHPCTNYTDMDAKCRVTPNTGSQSRKQRLMVNWDPRASALCEPQGAHVLMAAIFPWL